MPYTTMGEHAPWNNPEEVKRLFYQGIKSHAAAFLNRDIDLVVEEDKKAAGDILSSMYREVWFADVYIADLTGSNPNVFLELGARWALRDRVTIIVNQDQPDVKLEFNVQSARVVYYSKDSDALQRAIEDVVKEIDTGLRKDKSDSPVRNALMPDVVSIPRAEHERMAGYEKTSHRLARQLSEAYIGAGRLTQNSKDKLAYFRRATEADPGNVNAWVERCLELRNRALYEDAEDEEGAIEVAKQGVSKLPNEAALHAQLGMAYSKVDKHIDDAIIELSRASELGPHDPETWSSLGGAYRRKAFESRGDGGFNVYFAIKARESYQKALALAEPDLSPGAAAARAYAVGNIARLGFVLSHFDPSERVGAIQALRRLRNICNEALRNNGGDYYSRFDLADTYLLNGEVDDGRRLYHEGIDAVPQEYRAAVLSSVIGPLRQYVTIGLGDHNMRSAMREILGELEQAAG